MDEEPGCKGKLLISIGVFSVIAIGIAFGVAPCAFLTIPFDNSREFWQRDASMVFFYIGAAIMIVVVLGTCIRKWIDGSWDGWCEDVPDPQHNQEASVEYQKRLADVNARRERAGFEPVERL